MSRGTQPPQEWPSWSGNQRITDILLPLFIPLLYRTGALYFPSGYQEFGGAKKG